MQSGENIDIDDGLLVADDETDEESENKHLLFQIGDEEYGVRIDRVQSIEEMLRVVAIPDMPDYVRGVINLRGAIVPVIELRLRFGMEHRDYDDRTCIIIIRGASRMVGFIVDSVREVHPIPAAHIQPAPEFTGVGGTEQFVTGLGTVEGEVKILLDIDRLMRNEDLPEEALNLTG
ncbi:MAG: chemotaxis protein CheW [Spirochaetota bacterium]